MRRLATIPFLICVLIFSAGFDGFKSEDGFGSSDGLNIADSGLYASGGAADTVIAVFSSYGNLIVPEVLIDHYDLDPADSTYSYTPNSGAIFRHGSVDRGDSLNCVNNIYNRFNFYDNAGTQMPASAQTYGLVYFDLDLIPDNVEILDAYLCMEIAWGTVDGTSATFQKEKFLGVYAVLDTMVSDAAWLDAPVGDTSCDASIPPYGADISWVYCDNDLSTPWEPRLYMRRGRTEYGSLGMFGMPSKAFGQGTNPTTGDTLYIDVKREVQYYKDYKDIRGITNSGWWITAYSDAGQGDVQVSCGDDTEINTSPCLIVKWRDKPKNNWRYSGKPMALCMTTDDGFKEYNYALAETCALYGFLHTAFVSEVYIEAGSIGGRDIMTSSEAQVLRAGGTEIGQHTKDHIWPGLIDIADADSVHEQLCRDYLVAYLGISAADSADVLKTIAWPFGSYSALTESIAYEYGYIAARSTVGDIFPTSASGYWRSSAGHGVSPFTSADSLAIFATSKYTYTRFFDDNGGSDDTVDTLKIAHKITPVTRINGNIANFMTLAWMMQEPITTLTHHEAQLTLNQIGWLMEYLDWRGDFAVPTYGSIAEGYRDNYMSETLWWLWEED